MPSKAEQAKEILEKVLVEKAEASSEPVIQEPIVTQEPIDTQESVIDSDETIATDEGPIQLSDIAAHLGCDVADLYDVLVPMPHSEEPVALGALKDSERKARKVTSQLRELEAKRELLEKELSTLRSNNSIGMLPPQLDALRFNAAQWHNYVNNNPDYWKNLRENDSAEYAAAFTEAQNKAREAAMQFQIAHTHWQTEQERQFKEVLSKNRAKLSESDSVWSDETELKNRYSVIKNWLRDENATVPDDLESVLIDPGWVTALYKAAVNAQANKQIKDSTPKKVGSAKLRRGALKSGTKQKQKLDALIKRAGNSHSRSEKMAAATAILEDAFRPK